MRRRFRSPEREMWAVMWAMYAVSTMAAMLLAEWVHFNSDTPMVWERWFLSWGLVLGFAAAAWSCLRPRPEVYEVNEGGERFRYVANSYAEARAMFLREWFPDNPEDAEPVLERVPHFWPITIRLEEESDLERLTRDHKVAEVANRAATAARGFNVTATAAVWARWNGCGLLSSSVV